MFSTAEVEFPLSLAGVGGGVFGGVEGELGTDGECGDSLSEIVGVGLVDFEAERREDNVESAAADIFARIEFGKPEFSIVFEVEIDGLLFLGGGGETNLGRVNLLWTGGSGSGSRPAVLLKPEDIALMLVMLDFISVAIISRALRSVLAFGNSPYNFSIYLIPSKKDCVLPRLRHTCVARKSGKRPVTNGFTIHLLRRIVRSALMSALSVEPLA